MKQLLTILLLGAVLCFAGCTGAGQETDTAAQTTDTPSDVQTDAPTGTGDGYTKRY